MEEKGAGLGNYLKAQIAKKTSGDTTRASVIASMASAGGIDESTVEQILSGSIKCPPIGRLQGFGKALGVGTAAVVNAAKGDGCMYDAESQRSLACPNCAIERHFERVENLEKRLGKTNR